MQIVNNKMLASFPYVDGWYLTGIVAPSMSRRGRKATNRMPVGPIGLCVKVNMEGTITSYGRYQQYADGSTSFLVSTDGIILRDLVSDIFKDV